MESPGMLPAVPATCLLDKPQESCALEELGERQGEKVGTARRSTSFWHLYALRNAGPAIKKLA